jgi:hypothetical protein
MEHGAGPPKHFPRNTELKGISGDLTDDPERSNCTRAECSVLTAGPQTTKALLTDQHILTEIELIV